MTPNNVELALAHLQQTLDHQDTKITQILERLDALTTDLAEFADQMEETVYRLNRERDEYHDDVDN